jgi:hypothetical protein
MHYQYIKAFIYLFILNVAYEHEKQNKSNGCIDTSLIMMAYDTASYYKHALTKLMSEEGHWIFLAEEEEPKHVELVIICV